MKHPFDDFSFSPSEASLLASVYLASVKKESVTTLRVIGAIPADKCQYRPEPNSRSALELAWHLAYGDIWFLKGFLIGKFEMEEEEDSMPGDITSPQDITCCYQDAFALKLAKVSKLTPEFWASRLSFFGMFNDPAVLYLQFMLNHSIHHRGQLCAYLRPMGGKVPNIYGGSFDEPMVEDC